MRVLSLNTGGLRDHSKRASLCIWLSCLHQDIIFLQETHSRDSAELDSWFANTDFQAYGDFHTTKSRGVAILLRKSLNLSVLTSTASGHGRFLLLKVAQGSHSFSLCCIYAPNHNPEKADFFIDLHNYLDPSGDTIMAGDFNSVMDRTIDRMSFSFLHHSYDCSDEICTLFEDFRLLDIWRHQHPNLKSYTFFTHSGLSSSRIDLIGLPLRFVPCTSSTDILPCPHSDHSAVIAVFSFPEETPHGPYSWKLNVSCLEDPSYISIINNFWSTWRLRKPSFRSLHNWWDLGKRHIQDLTVRFCSSKRKSARSRRDELDSRARSLKSLLDQGDSSVLSDYRAVLDELGQLDATAATAAAVRARAQWIEQGECSSAFFLRLEKQRSSNRTIDLMLNSAGEYVSDTQELIDVWANFYSDLFSCCHPDSSLQDSFLDTLESSLSNDQRNLCEGLLLPEECLLALQGMSNGKAPGLDGLPKEFYSAFWNTLGGDLVSVLNYSFDAGFLSHSQRIGVISLSHKKGPRYLCKNWRPISLLNVDYKIASRALALRLRKVIHHVVSPDQTCSVPGRFIGENVRLLQDAITYASLSDSKLAILSLDQEKAFDRVDWDYMISVLHKMGFGPMFISWVRLLYTQPSATILVNGFFSTPISLSRGVRQGCPLSAPLYVLVAETLACRLRADLSLTGLRLPLSPSSAALVSQYADDTSLLCTSDEEITAVFSIYADYECATGAKLNLEKSKGLWCGSWRNRSSSPINLDWSSTSMKCLGVHIGHGDLEPLNWDDRIEKLASLLRSWHQRHLSLSGKSLVLNALALSGLWYSASVLHLPEWTIKKINSLIYPFFWSGKKELVSRQTLSHPPLSGGVGLADCKLKSLALKVSWVRRYVEHPNAKWSCFMSFFLHHFLGVNVVELLTFPAFYPIEDLPPFYGQLFNAWALLEGTNSASRGISFKAVNGAMLPVTASRTKDVYTALCKHTLPSPRCMQKFGPQFPHLRWEQTWRQVSVMPLDRKARDAAWKISHGVMLTADRLTRFGMSVDPACFCGQAPESAQHLFFDCFFISSLLLWAQTLFLRAAPRCPSINVRHIFFGFNRDEAELVPPVFAYLLHLIKYFVWLARNDFRFNGNRPHIPSVRARVTSRLNTHLIAFSRRFKTPSSRRLFHNSWNVLGKFSPDIHTVTF